MMPHLHLATLLVLCLYLIGCTSANPDKYTVPIKFTDIPGLDLGNSTHAISEMGPTKFLPRDRAPPHGGGGGGSGYYPISAELYSEWNCSGPVQFYVYLLNGDNGKCILLSKGPNSGYHGIIIRYDGQVYGKGGCGIPGTTKPKLNECQHFTTGDSFTGIRLD